MIIEYLYIIDQFQDDEYWHSISFLIWYFSRVTYQFLIWWTEQIPVTDNGRGGVPFGITLENNSFWWKCIAKMTGLTFLPSRFPQTVFLCLMAVNYISKASHENWCSYTYTKAKSWTWAFLIQDIFLASIGQESKINVSGKQLVINIWHRGVN